jgi:hypothetical protein
LESDLVAGNFQFRKNFEKFLQKIIAAKIFAAKIFAAQIAFPPFPQTHVDVEFVSQKN